MLKAPKWFTEVIAPFASLFTKPTWETAQTLLVGSLLAPGKRTVTAILSIVGLSQESGFVGYHRFLNRAKWSAVRASRVLLNELIRHYVPTGPLLIGVDDTIERRRGKKIRAKGIYRDPVRSSHSHFVKTSGLRWLSFMLLAPVPFAQRVWALPFLTALVPSEGFWKERGKPHRTLTQTAYRLLRVVQRWCPDRQIIVLADGAYAIIRWLAELKQGKAITVVTRVRLDIMLYEKAPERQKGQRGRPRVKGQRLPSLKSILENPKTEWERAKLSDWYGEKDREVDYVTGLGLWYRNKEESVYGGWVILRDPLGKFRPQALFCTDEQVKAIDMLGWFPMRWQVEVTFEESRAHLGVETGRGWSDSTIGRTTPLLFGLFSLVTLLAQRLTQERQINPRRTAWYAKERPTFSDALAAVRKACWSIPLFDDSTADHDWLKIPRHLFQRMSDALCYAA